MIASPLVPRKLRRGDTIRVVAPALSRALVAEHDRSAIIDARFADLGLRLTFGDHVDERDDFESPTRDRTGPASGCATTSSRPCPGSPRPCDLTSLLQQPGAVGVQGVVIGRFQEASQVSRHLLEQIIARQDRLAGLPVLANVDFGHTNPLATFPIGGRASLIVGAASSLRLSDA